MASSPKRLWYQHMDAVLCYPGLSWLEALPLVMLGIRSAVKEDLGASAAELVYGEPLRLPGAFFSPSPSTPANEDVTDFVVRLRQQMAQLRSVPASRHATPSAFIFGDLASCSHVFLRDDTVRRSLQPPYRGPYPVASRDDKTVTLTINGKDTRVTIDRVKPAYSLSDHPDDHAQDEDGDVDDSPPPPPDPAAGRPPTPDARLATQRPGRGTATPPLPPAPGPATCPAPPGPQARPHDGVTRSTRSGRRVRFPAFFQPG